MPEAEAALPAGAADDLELLRGVAVEAGRIAMRYFRQSPEVWLKGGVSPVSEADYAVDHFLRDALGAARPDYGWLSEETADTAERLDRARTFVVDPIDGTRGFLEHLDRWCVSIAVVEGGRSIAGVLECPARGETFWATAGQGAWKDGRRLAVKPVGREFRIAGPKPLIDAMPERLLSGASRVAHVPSLAYRVAMIADGSLDATFVKPNAHDWDLAAADLILDEAGGSLVDPLRRRPLYAGPQIRHGYLAAAGRGPLLDALADVIAAAH